jgi:hypothetical protein
MLVAEGEILCPEGYFAGVGIGVHRGIRDRVVERPKEKKGRERPRDDRAFGLAHQEAGRRLLQPTGEPRKLRAAAVGLIGTGGGHGCSSLPA